MLRLTLLVILLQLSVGCSRPAPPIVIEDEAVEIVETDVAFVERLGGSVTRE